jgi:hypothetical protein
VKVCARVAVSTLSALAVLVLVSGPVARADEFNPAASSPAIGTTQVVAKIPAPGLSDRVPRLVPITPVRLSQMHAMPLVSALVCIGVVGRFRRRVSDAGHDWRCLLVGAPPPLR